MVLILLFSTVTAEAASGEQGETTSVSFSFPSCMAVDGNFTFSGEGTIYEVVGDPSYSSSLAGGVNKSVVSLYSGTGSASTVSVTFSVKILSSATVGATGSITCTYQIQETDTISGVLTQTQNITVEATPEPEPEATTTPSTPSSTTTPSTTTTTTTVEEEPEPLDYSELEAVITEVQELVEPDYTAESWGLLVIALEDANEALSASTQSKINKAVTALQEAMEALVAMDYTALIAEIEEVQGYIDENNDTEIIGAIFDELLALLEDASELLTSGDQEAVYAMVVELHELFFQTVKDYAAQLLNLLEEAQAEDEVVVEEVVEVEPETNMIWPIIIGILIVIAILAYIYFFIIKKKKKEEDETPLVEYYMEDDDEFDDEFDEEEFDDDAMLDEEAEADIAGIDKAL